MSINSKERLLDLSSKINDISHNLEKKYAEILEQELKAVCELYEIPPHKIYINLFPDGVHRISIVLSEFQITNNFTYGD